MPLWLLRYVPYAIGAALLVWGLWTVNGWREDAQELPKVRTDFVRYQAEAQRQFKVAYTASKGYQDELQTLRANASPVRTVRLCVSPAVPAARRPAGGHHEPTAPARVLPPVAGEDSRQGADIGPDLAQLAARADELSAQLRACQHLLAP